MTKPGFTSLTVSTQLRDQLKTRAGAQGVSIPQLITQMLSVNVHVDVGVSINTTMVNRINTTPQNQPQMTPFQAPAANGPQTMPQTPFSLSEGSLFAKRESSAGGVGFEPTTTGLGGLRPIRARLR